MLLLSDILVQVSMGTILHDQIVFLGSLYDLMQLYDAFMVQALMDLNFVF